MSAWLVDREHVDVLLRFGMSGGGIQGRRVGWRSDTAIEAQAAPFARYLDIMTADEAGRVLWVENVRSLDYRYGESEPDVSFTVEDAALYVYRDPGYVLTPGEALKACACLEYQSCERPDYRESEAFRLLESIRDLAVGMLSEGPWGWDRDAIAKAKAADRERDGFPNPARVTVGAGPFFVTGLSEEVSA